MVFPSSVYAVQAFKRISILYLRKLRFTLVSKSVIFYFQLSMKVWPFFSYTDLSAVSQVIHYLQRGCLSLLYLGFRQMHRCQWGCMWLLAPLLQASVHCGNLTPALCLFNTNSRYTDLVLKSINRSSFSNNRS